MPADENRIPAIPRRYSEIFQPKKKLSLLFVHTGSGAWIRTKIASSKG